MSRGGIYKPLYMGRLALKTPRKRSANKHPISRHSTHFRPTKRRIPPIMSLHDKPPTASGAKKSLYKRLAEASDADKVAASHIIEAQERGLAEHLSKKVEPSAYPGTYSGRVEYELARARMKQREKDLDFDSRCRAEASPAEEKAERIIQMLRQKDKEQIYDKAPPRHGHANQAHKRFAGDHFLSNIDLIEQTELFKVARQMPKGTHLHIHLNACLKPSVLLDMAAEMDDMYIKSNRPLIHLPSDPDGKPNRQRYLNFDACAIEFSIEKRTVSTTDNLFSPNYDHDKYMRFKEFIRQWNRLAPYGDLTAMQWLQEKVQFNEEEAHGPLQTAGGAWELFNNRTKMMKGLFNYEFAFRAYMRLLLQDFIDEKILYAEIRPTFMSTNYLFTDKGERLDNKGIMRIIVDEVTSFLKSRGQNGEVAGDGPFHGIKVIYCTPRSLPNELIEVALKECREFNNLFPGWIAGFDVVGEEAQGKPLHEFADEFQKFKRDCADEGVEIPFLFHCGETLDMNTDTDGNLIDALLLGAKRIAHGFALTKHPHIMEQMKVRGVCLELCPISNEILGLTPRVAGHSMYSLLANNVHCTVNSDNGTIFRSSLSHDFYQVLVGRGGLGLYGWKQLALWSIEHACLDDEEKKEVLESWEDQWENFLKWIEEQYSDGLRKSEEESNMSSSSGLGKV